MTPDMASTIRPRVRLSRPGRGFRRFVGGFPAGVFLLLAATGAWAKGRRPPVVEFVLEPPVPVAGRTLAVRCVSSVPLKDPALSWDGRRVLFFPRGKREYQALVGVSSMEAPGAKEAFFAAEWRKKRVVRSTVSFAVEAGTYPVSRVPLTKSQNNLFTSGQLERDGQVLSAVYKRPPLPRKLWAGFFVAPTTGVVSSVFGARRAYGDRPPGSGHSGLDIANEEGTPVFAPNRGRVVFSGRLESFGNVVMLDHGQGVYSYYLHMKEALLKDGVMAETGAPLGVMGAEGLATGPHLHWTMIVGGEKVDPVEWTEREFE